MGFRAHTSTSYHYELHVHVSRIHKGLTGQSARIRSKYGAILAKPLKELNNTILFLC